MNKRVLRRIDPPILNNRRSKQLCSCLEVRTLTQSQGRLSVWLSSHSPSCSTYPIIRQHIYEYVRVNWLKIHTRSSCAKFIQGGYEHGHGSPCCSMRSDFHANPTAMLSSSDLFLFVVWRRHLVEFRHFRNARSTGKSKHDLHIHYSL